MGDWLANQSVGQVIALLSVAGGLLIAITAVLSGAWVRVRRGEMQAHLAELDNALKQEMIEKGMSAEEIERVLTAGSGKGSKPKPVVESRTS